MHDFNTLHVSFSTYRYSVFIYSWKYAVPGTNFVQKIKQTNLIY